MAAKCILSSPPRRGKKLKEQTLSIIRNRAQRWLNGERDSLWTELQQSVPAHRRIIKKDNLTWKMNRCMELARDGPYSRACKALLSSGIASSSGEALEEMRAKHPQSERTNDDDDFSPVPHGFIPEIDHELTRKMINSFSR